MAATLRARSHGRISHLHIAVPQLPAHTATEKPTVPPTSVALLTVDTQSFPFGKVLLIVATNEPPKPPPVTTVDGGQEAAIRVWLSAGIATGVLGTIV